MVSAQITDKDAGGATQSPLVDAEAFLDPPNTTPAGGSGLQLIAVDGKMDATTEAVYGLIPLSQIKALSDGTHHVYVRGEDAAGNWGALYGVNLVVDKAAPVLGVLTATPNPTNGAANLTLSAPVTDASTLATAEYWLGTVDPGVGKASAVPVSVVSGKIVVTVPLGAVPAGTQQFNLRVKDLAGNWSKAISVSVQVVKPNLIFKNGFEVGEPAWSASTGPVSYTAAAAMEAARGMQVTPTTGNRAGYLTDNSPTAEPTYHARFAFNPHNLTSGSAAATVLTLFQATTAANATGLRPAVPPGEPGHGAGSAGVQPLNRSGRDRQLVHRGGRDQHRPPRLDGRHQRVAEVDDQRWPQADGHRQQQHVADRHRPAWRHQRIRNRYGRDRVLRRLLVGAHVRAVTINPGVTLMGVTPGHLGGERTMSSIVSTFTGRLRPFDRFGQLLDRSAGARQSSSSSASRSRWPASRALPMC